MEGQADRWTDMDKNISLHLRWGIKIVKQIVSCYYLKYYDESFVSLTQLLPYLFGYKTGVSPLQNDYK